MTNHKELEVNQIILIKIPNQVSIIGRINSPSGPTTIVGARMALLGSMMIMNRVLIVISVRLATNLLNMLFLNSKTM